MRRDVMNDYLVTLSGYSYFTRHTYYVMTTAKSCAAAAAYRYEDEDDGELEVVDVRLIDDELMDDIQRQLHNIQRQQMALPLMSAKRDELERQAYDLRQQWDAILDSDIAWA